MRDYGCDGQIGLEGSPADFVTELVEVFAEVWRVLKGDGTLWLNIGDTYAGGGRGMGSLDCKQRTNRGSLIGASPVPVGLKPKDLIGIPWRVAFALQDYGWYLRSDIIWHKPNAMPESVTDRPTKSHEYIFLLSKNERYYYDAEAIAEPVSVAMLQQVEDGYEGLGLKDYESNGVQNPSSVKTRIIENARKKQAKWAEAERNAASRRMMESTEAARGDGGVHDSPFGMTRNKRSVWTVTTSPYMEAHFATFPPDLIKPCILAGSKIGDTVLDPFAGSGTTGMVALDYGRKAILCELNPSYIELIRQRCHVTPGML